MKCSSLFKNTYYIAGLCAVLAAVAYAVELPFSKLMFASSGTLMTLAFCFFGGAAGLALCAFFGRKTSFMDTSRNLRKSDMPVFIFVILTSAAANILIYLGLDGTSASDTSILSNFVTVASALIALFIFKEKIPKRLWIGIIFITLGMFALSSSEDAAFFSFSFGSVFILLGCITMGLYFNLLNRLADRNPIQVNIIRCFFGAAGIFLFALCAGESIPSIVSILEIMLIGFISFGLSGLFMMYAQREFNVAKTSAIIGIYPLISVVISFILFQEMPEITFLAALVLVIPGMYFAITKNRAEEPDDDEYINAEKYEGVFLTSMPVSLKNEMRNYATSFGFLVMAVLYILILFSINDVFSGTLTDAEAYSSMTIPAVIIGIVLLLCGIVLLLLRNRVLSAVTFIFSSALCFLYACEDTSYFVTPMISLFSLVLALVLLTSASPKKYAYALINGMCGLVGFPGIAESDTIMGMASIVLMIVCAVMLIYFSLACAAQKIHLPLTKFLTTDDDMTFSRSGPVLGYLFIGSYLFMWIIHNYVGGELFPVETTNAICLSLSLMIIAIGLMAFGIGKMRFTPLMFLGVGCSFLLDLFVTGSMHYVVGILLLILGIFAVIRKNSRLLPSLLLIGFGFARFLSNSIESYPDLITVVSILNAACMLLAVYLAFAVFSEKFKLPLF